MAQASPPRPLFLAGSAGRLFAVVREPLGAPRDFAVVIVPPFAEEMNRCRRMAALQMQALAAAGVGSLLLDLYGTGDSEGGFGDARWEIWRSDVGVAMDWLRGEGWRRIALLGIRLGGLLAAEATAGAERLVLWQPVTSGEAMLTQFLRLRLAGDMASQGVAKVTTRDLRAALGRGEVLEIAGYDLHPALAAAIDRLRLGASTPTLPIHWLEVAADPAAGLSPAASPIVAAWSAAGAVIAGEPFWALQETTIAPALIAATTAILVGSAP